MAGYKDGPGTSQYPGKYVGDKARIKPGKNPAPVTPKTGKSGKSTTSVTKGK